MSMVARQRVAQPALSAWQHRRGALVVEPGGLVMAILNVTPDSFSDAGRFADPERAIERALQLAELGVDIIDIGGESTRPGASPVSLQQELDRVLPVIAGVRAASDVVISVDTWKAGVAEAALLAGADIINDVSGLQDPGMVNTIRRFGAGIAVMHLHAPLDSIHDAPLMQGDIVHSVCDSLRESVARLTDAGISERQIAVDPGLGFGKSLEQNYALLASLDQALPANCTRLIGASRKRMIRSVVPAGPDAVEAGTLTAHVAAIMNGAHVVRVHNAEAALAARCVLRALLAASPATW